MPRNGDQHASEQVVNMARNIHIHRVVRRGIPPKAPFGSHVSYTVSGAVRGVSQIAGCGVHRAARVLEAPSGYPKMLRHQGRSVRRRSYGGGFPLGVDVHRIPRHTAFLGDRPVALALSFEF